MKKEESRKEISQKFFVLVVFKFGVFGVFEFCFFFWCFCSTFSLYLLSSKNSGSSSNSSVCGFIFEAQSFFKRVSIPITALGIVQNK